MLPCYLVLLVSILLVGLRVLDAAPCNIGIAGGQAQRVVGGTNGTGSRANVQRDQLFIERSILNC